MKGALAQAGITGVDVTVSGFEKTLATEGAEGIISGTITVTSGDKTESIEINKMIPKVTVTDEEKVKAAKGETQSVLDKLAVTNETTETDIISAVKKALAQAGITGVDVTVSGFEKTPATTSAEGNIQGSITVTSGDKTDSIEINKTIAKLTVIDEEKVKAAKGEAQNVLDKLEVTNETTEEDIIRAVKTAVDTLGYGGITVTMNGFTKNAATKAAAGKITGTIILTLNEKTAETLVSIEIAKLPSGPEPTPGATGKPTGTTPGGKRPVPSAAPGTDNGDIAVKLGVSEETAAKIKTTIDELGVSVSTLLVTDSSINSFESEGDVAGSSFAKIQAKGTSSKKSVKLKWNKVKGADGYLIYGTKCGKKNKYKLLKTINKGSKKTYTQKKRKKATFYKYIVRAYNEVEGQKISIAVSKTIHVVTDGGKYGDAKSVKVKKKKVTIKKGKTFQIKASEVRKSKTKKIRRHRKINYESDNTKVATVTKKGKIKAKAKGTCIIYVYAQNGVYRKVKVTVK